MKKSFVYLLLLLTIVSTCPPDNGEIIYINYDLHIVLLRINGSLFVYIFEIDQQLEPLAELGAGEYILFNYVLGPQGSVHILIVGIV